MGGVPLESLARGVPLAGGVEFGCLDHSHTIGFFSTQAVPIAAATGSLLGLNPTSGLGSIFAQLLLAVML